MIDHMICSREKGRKKNRIRQTNCWSWWCKNI